MMIENVTMPNTQEADNLDKRCRIMRAAVEEILSQIPDAEVLMQAKRTVQAMDYILANCEG
jgi:hypothetical protein